MTTPSEDERRRLDEIEAALRASDPGLDRALRTFRLRRRRSVACLTAGWLGAVGAALAGWWILALLMIGPLLTMTFVTLSGRGRLLPSTAAHDGPHPPTWTRFWG